MTTNTSVFSRFKLPQKFIILGFIAIAMTIMPIYQFFYVTQSRVTMAEKELLGFQPTKDALAVVKPIQVHRGLTAAVMGGNQQMGEQLPPTRAALEKAMATFDDVMKSITSPDMQERWSKVKRDWGKLSKDLDNKSITAAESFASHTQMVMDVLWILEAIRDYYEISIEPNADNHYLGRATYITIPQMIEFTAQMRGFGAGLLSQSASLRENKKSAEATHTLSNLTKLNTMVERVRSTMNASNENLNKAGQINPNIQVALQTPLLESGNATKQGVDLAVKEILESQTQTYAAPTYFANITKVMDTQSALSDAAIVALGDLLRANVASLRQQQFQVAATMFLLIIFGSVMAYLIVRTITHPIEHLEGVMAKLEQGDSSIRANLDTKDEIGELARQFDSMMDQRESVATRIREENEQLNESIINLLHGVAKLSQKDLTAKVFVAEDITGAVADALNMLSQETAKVLQQVTDISADVTSASLRVKQQSDTVLITARTEREQVMKTSEELQVAADGMARIEELAEIANAAADNAIRTTQVALSTVSATVTGINSTRETIRETEKRIKRLGERSQEISSVVGIINTIAERTHILALNASMHAASAGEAGRGFAVVAEEVQRLAESSRQATAQIATLVSNIQMETADTVTTMNSAISQVVDGSRLAEQAGEQMKLTQATTANLVDSVRQIALSSHEQAKLSSDLLIRSAEIRKSTEKTSQELTEQSAETENLVQYAKALLGSVRVFKLPA
jgi:twitching motility protein PilJ